jgi:hypothetical protein
MRSSLRTETPLPCTVCWGTDPKIELKGTAVEIGVDTVIIVVDDGDRRLWPTPGRKVQVEVEWPGEMEGLRKSLRCRGTVEVALESANGGIRLSCRIRTGRFTDAQSRKSRTTQSVTDWTM